MKTAKYLYRNGAIDKSLNDLEINHTKCQLVLGFGEKKILSDNIAYDCFRKKFPNADIALCSGAGEIYGDEVLDESLSVIAIEFEKTKIISNSIKINSFETSYEAGAALVKNIDKNNLKYIFVLSDGSKVNGSELVSGIESVIQHTIPVTGGLAGDGINFNTTTLGLNGDLQSGNIIAIGFYGDAIKVNHSSMGGWEIFGLEKKITKSRSNELFEIDNESALELYKKYLGKYADELPGSALLFPLSIVLPGYDEPIVRTILSVNNEHNSMTFAGDVPEGSKVRFMRANFDKIVDAAGEAAQNTLPKLNTTPPQLAILISCVGRKIILGKRVDEEVLAVRDVFGKNTMLSGFYSYGEISPFNSSTKCELHNQTMTITTFDEL